MIELKAKIKELMTEADSVCARLDKDDPSCGFHVYVAYVKEYNYNKGKRNAYSNVLKMIGALEESKGED